MLNLGTRWMWVVSALSQAFYPLKQETLYSLCRRLGTPLACHGRVQKVLFLWVFEPLAIQPKASSYTKYAIPAHFLKLWYP
jgi:hypothetical protein